MGQVYFEKDILNSERLKKLRDAGYQAVDMHFHSQYSLDGLSKICSVMKKCDQNHFGVAITDHNQIKGALKISKKNVFVIPGIEVSCHNGIHVLLHFYSFTALKSFYNATLKKRLKNNPWFIDLDYEELIDIARQHECIVTAPHPFGPGFCGIKKWDVPDKIIKKLDAIEVINSSCTRDMNKKALAWATKASKPFTGGSDGHCLSELGNCLTLCKADTIPDFLDEIRKGRSIVIGREEPIIEDAVHAVGKFIEEEHSAPRKLIKNMWKDRMLLEWFYLTRRFRKGLPYYYHAHHKEPDKNILTNHKYTRHLTKYVHKINDKGRRRKSQNEPTDR